MKWSRQRKLDHFYALRGMGTSVLDVGVSCYDHSDQVNVFLKSFKDDPGLYTGLAVQPVEKIEKLYPGRRFVQYPGGTFPFADSEFDWVFSNAVIEHVGDRQAQKLFINEMLRVSSRIFFTTPNKYFPVESHTNTWFRHWNNDHFYKWCKSKDLYWNRDNLQLMSRKYLQNLLQDSNAREFEISSNRILGWPMTFTVVCE